MNPPFDNDDRSENSQSKNNKNFTRQNNYGKANNMNSQNNGYGNNKFPNFRNKNFDRNNRWPQNRPNYQNNNYRVPNNNYNHYNMNDRFPRYNRYNENGNANNQFNRRFNKNTNFVRQAYVEQPGSKLETEIVDAPVSECVSGNEINNQEETETVAVNDDKVVENNSETSTDILYKCDSDNDIEGQQIFKMPENNMGDLAVSTDANHSKVSQNYDLTFERIDTKPMHIPSGEQMYSEEEKLKLNREIIGILNLITPTNFQKCIDKFESMVFNDQTKIDALVDQFFNKAILDTVYADLYTKLYVVFMKKISNFTELFLTKSRLFFQSGIIKAIENERALWQDKINNEPSTYLKEHLELMTDERINKVVDRYAGNLTFICALFNAGHLQGIVILKCIFQLLSDIQDYQSIELACKIFVSCGKKLSCDKDISVKERLRFLLSKLKDISNESSLRSKTKFAIMEVIDTERRNWAERKIVKELKLQPKEIDETIQKKITAKSQDCKPKYQNKPFFKKFDQNSQVNPTKPNFNSKPFGQNATTKPMYNRKQNYERPMTKPPRKPMAKRTDEEMSKDVLESLEKGEMNFEGWIKLSKPSYFIKEYLEIMLSRNTAFRQTMGDFFMKLVRHNVMGEKELIDASADIIEDSEIYEIDIPDFWIYFAEFLERFIQETPTVSNTFFAQFLRETKKCEKVVSFIKEFAAQRINEVIVSGQIGM